MEPERWRRVEDLYHRALQIAAARRIAFLEDSCPQDEALRREVESLLAHDQAAENFIESPALQIAGKLLASDLTIGADGATLSGDDRTIGPYRLIQLLGAGGMGEVWLAEQNYPVRRRVALKLIRAGMNTREVVTRFESERQALALMDHPAVARVFDGGSTSSGLPYFAMEYVPGVPITDWCDKCKLTVAERLELFMQVCEGVKHAHQRAIIHRDLKPSNILITKVDGHAAPKIIDFGVAKAVGHKLSEETLLTRVGAILGTPEYMSPEQADSAGGDIDTRTDVYSLGVILYQLLAGAAPIELTQLTFEGMLRQLREDDPPRPSAKVRALGELSTNVCVNRGSAPRALIRQLRGDLDSIVLKALEKQRARRYGSPSELAADVERYLCHEPVMARPASTGYRAVKYVRRHRIGVAFATAVVLLLAVFAIAQTFQVQRITRERNRADRVTSFMTGMFKVSDPSEARGNKVTAREILDKASDEISMGLVQDPELRAQMMHTMSTVYSNLGLVSRAESLIRRTVQIQSQVLGSNHPDTLRSEFDLGISLSDEGHYEQAEKLQRRTMESLRRVLGPEHPDTLKSMNSLAIDLTEEGRYREAETLHRQILGVRRRLLGPEHYDTLLSMSNLAANLIDQRRYTEGGAMARQTLIIANRTLGQDHPLTLSLTANLASALLQERHYAEAEPLLRHSLEVRRRVLGPEHRLTLDSMTNWALLLMYMGQYAKAEEQLRNVRDIQRRTLGPDHPDIAASTYNLACVATRKGDHDAAFLLLREALDQDPSHGFVGFIDNDPDLQPLHADPRFAALVTYAKRRNATSVKKK